MRESEPAKNGREREIERERARLSTLNERNSNFKWNDLAKMSRLKQFFGNDICREKTLIMAGRGSLFLRV
jgi:hypothetical protein